MDNPSFSEFCKALTAFYVNDDLSPGIIVSQINDPNLSDPSLWYIAVHRYPYAGSRRAERVVVCSQTRMSFGIALLFLWKVWNKVKNLSSEEEYQRLQGLDENGDSVPQTRRRRRRLNSSD